MRLPISHYEFFSPKIVLWLSVSEDFVILACVVFTQCQRVFDRRTDGRTDGQTSLRWLLRGCIAGYADALEKFSLQTRFLSNIICFEWTKVAASSSWCRCLAVTRRLTPHK